MSEVKNLKELEESMVILAYQGLDSQFGALGPEALAWLQKNFAGTSLKIAKNGSEVVIPMAEATDSDTAIEILDFPDKLQHLCIVTPKLIRELSKRKFSQFLVQEQSKEEIHAAAVKQTQNFVKQVSGGAVVREKATAAMEELMDSFGQGSLDLTAVEGVVEEIISTNYGSAMASISGLKQSHQVYAHCVDVGVIYLNIYEAILEKKNKKSIFKDRNEILFAALMHDIGKSLIPKEIIENEDSFDRNSPEMLEIRKHPENSVKLLKDLNLPDYIVNLASHHHVKYDQNNVASYPEDFKQDEALYETKLLAIIDIFQALVGSRQYKKSWSAPAAIRFIDALAGIELDPEVWEDFLSVSGNYPIGSFVEISDKRQGFVMSLNSKDLAKPKIVVIRDSEGNDLDHSLVDLSQEPDLKITKDYDPHDLFGEKALDLYKSLQPK